MRRIYTNLLEDHLAKNRQMILLSGPRQVGKTTLARAVLPEAVYLNFDITGDALKIMGGVEKIAEVLALDVPSKRARSVIFDELHKYAKWKHFLKGFLTATKKT